MKGWSWLLQVVEESGLGWCRAETGDGRNGGYSDDYGTSTSVPSLC
jgi:hypothetical protein